MGDLKQILILMESMNGGGAEKVLIEFLKNLNYSRYNIDLLLIHPGGVYEKNIPSKVNTSYLFKNRFQYRFVKRLSKVFRMNYVFIHLLSKKIKKTYEVEISFLEGPSVKLHSLIGSCGKKISWVHCNLIENDWWRESFFSFDDAFMAYQKMDEIIFVSSDAKYCFERLFTGLSIPMKVMYNPINKEEIIKRSFDIDIITNRFTICTIGRLQPQKAFNRLLEVAFLLKQDELDFEIWILGDGYLLQSLVEQARKLNISDRLKFFGFLENPYPYLRASHLFVSTSITEGFPLVVAEAVCLGKAIVATSVTGTTEILNNGESGILTGQRVEEIYLAIRQVMLDEEMRKNMETKAHIRSDMFDISETVKQFEDLLDS